MATLTLQLFGRPDIRLDGVPVTGLNNKALAIVYYLAATRQTHSREMLAGLLWSDYTEQRARGNLRVELGKLRPFLAPHLTIQRSSVAIDYSSSPHIDINIFENNLNQPEPSADQIEAAVALYRGEFLADFSVKGAPLFEEWQIVQHERLRQIALSALNRLATGYAQNKLYDHAITAVRHLLTIEPWSETGHRELMRLLALNGQQYAALSHYDSCKETLAAELGVDLAPETEALYQQILNGEIEADPEAAALTIESSPQLPPPFQPLPLTNHFVGRDAEIAQMREQLTQPNGPHLLALVGMGGIGKTTLANQMCHALRDEFPDGVLWADAAASEPFDILDSWGQAYGFDFSGLSDVKNRAAAVRGLLANKQVLLVMDDVFELSRIRPLLPNGEKCVVLLTTRNLDVAHSLNASVIQVGELSAANGRQLLINIIGAERVAAEPEAAAEIGRLLAYHPLAMEIIAQRLKSRRRRKLTNMATRLQAVQNRLDLQISDRAVRASFAVSWESLDAELRHAFSNLAVFACRPFSAAAAAAVAEMTPYKTEDTLDSLSALSLLREEGETQYRLHALMADFALEKMGEGMGEANGRMAIYYHTFAAANQTHYDVLNLEWQNLLAGMRVAHAQENWPLVLAYGHTLIDPWFSQIRYADIQTGMAWAKDAAATLDDESTLAYMEMTCGQASIERNEYETAVTHLENSLARFRALNDQARIAEIQFNLARIAIEQTEYEHALDRLKESKQIRQSLSDQNGVAAVLYREARVWAIFGPDIKKAVALTHEALAMQRKTKDIYWQINSLRLLTEIEIKRANISMAAQYCQEAYELSQKIQNKGEMAATLYYFSSIYRQQGNLDKAMKSAAQSLELFTQMGNLRFQSYLYFGLANIQRESGNLDGAIEACRQSVAIADSFDDKTFLVRIYIFWGDCLQVKGELNTAVKTWSKAKELAFALSNAKFIKELKSRIESVEKK